MKALRRSLLPLLPLFILFSPGLRGEAPFESHPLYRFATDYCEKNQLGLYVYYNRYAGNNEGIFAPIIATPDGGALLVATAGGDREAVVIRFDSARKILWKRSFRKAGKPAMEGRGAVALSDGGFYLDLGPYANPATANQIWLLKLDGNGNTVWELLFRGLGNDNNPVADRMQLGPDNSILIFGHIYPTLADIRAEKSRGWTAEVTASGKLRFEKTAAEDVNYSADETARRYPW